MILPPSWAVVLETLRPGFARRGTFTVFCVLATGMVAQTSRRSVVGMLSGARMAQTVSFHAACRFFSHAVWDIDRLGLLVTRLIVDRLLGPDEAITVVVDETLFKRWGRKVSYAFWTHCAMKRSVISLVQRGEIGGMSLDPMADPAPKGNIGDDSMPGN
jgi:DDE superfamily endonuclease